jgi:hypothetical protein
MLRILSVVVLLANFTGICLAINQSAAADDHRQIPILTYEQLVADPFCYRDQVIRVTGVYLWGFEIADLQDVDGNLDPTWVTFAPSSATCTRPEVNRAFAQVKRAQGRHPKGDAGIDTYSARVTFVGLFRMTPDGNDYELHSPWRYHLEVQCVDSVKMAPFPKGLKR